jgi:hypothetical protein
MIPRVKTLYGGSYAEPFLQATERQGTLSISKNVDVAVVCWKRISTFSSYALVPKQLGFYIRGFFDLRFLPRMPIFFASVLISLLSLSHPEANLNSISTFLWCQWKVRNDQLFGRKKSKPEKITLQARALLHNLEVSPLTPSTSDVRLLPSNTRPPKPGEMVSMYFDVAGPKLYVDAAWKTSPGQVVDKPGLGVISPSRTPGVLLLMFSSSRPTQLCPW